MFYSLVKVLLFIAAIAALSLGAGYLLHSGGNVRIAVSGWEISLGPIQAVIAALVIIALIWLAIRLIGLVGAFIRFLTGDETALSRYFDRNRERKGFEALSEGLMALASGEGRLAIAKAARAEKFLRRPELTNLVAAQAAEMVGDTKKAAEVYKRLLSDERTRFVGVRGILKQKLAEGDTATALKLAETANALKPRHEEVQDTLLRLQAGEGDWSGARGTLTSKYKTGSLPRDIHKRRDAALGVEEARTLLDAGKTTEGQDAAIEANKKSPDLIPAAVLAARAYIARGKPKYAARLLSRAWEANPHPDLAAAFAEIAPDETPAERIKRFRLLTAIHPQSEETMLLLAELNVAAEDFPAARRAIGALPETHPTARSLSIMAAIERGEGSDDAVVRGWLTKALAASRGAQWICDKCHSVHAEWVPICTNCGGFDTLSWNEAALVAAPSRTGAELLPLFVNAPTSARQPDTAEIDDAELADENQAAPSAN